MVESYSLAELNLIRSKGGRMFGLCLGHGEAVFHPELTFDMDKNMTDYPSVSTNQCPM